MAEGEAQTDYQAHTKGYSFFINLMKWGAIVTMIVTAIVVLIIGN